MKFKDSDYDLKFERLKDHAFRLLNYLRRSRQAPRILLLDNDPDMLAVMQEALTYAGYAVKGTGSLSEFHQQVRRWEPVLVILEHKLVGGDGTKLCRELKAAGKTRHIAVILCSAYIARNADKSAYGCDGLIAKPFGLEELHETVGRLLASV